MRAISVFAGAFLGCTVLFAQESPPNPLAATGPGLNKAANPKPPAINPALLYWQAIALLPEISTGEGKSMLAVVEGRSSSVESEAANLLPKARKSLERFARAASSPEKCVWGSTLEDGPSAPMPHLPKLQLLCRLTMVKSAECFAKGEHTEALDWLLHVHRAARHVAADPLLTTLLIQHAIEQQALRVTARHALALEPAVRERHLRKLGELPGLLKPREALQGEHAFSEWLMLSNLGIEQTPENEAAMLALAQCVLTTQAENQDSPTSGAAKEVLTSLQEWQRSIQQARSLHAALEAASAKSWKEFVQGLEDIRKDFADAPRNLLGALPGANGGMRKHLETETLHVMLRQALLHAETLPMGELSEGRDAFLAQPLQVTKEGDSYIISMKENPTGKACTLRVAR